MRQRDRIVVFIFSFFLTFLGNAGIPQGNLLEGIKPGPDGKIDLVAMFPHQDDELNVGGTFMLLKKEDARVRTHIICFTRGELSGAKNQLKISPEFQGKIRVKELQASASVLDADELIQLDYHDQGLTSADQNELKQKILELIEKTGAEVVFTYGPDGMSGHPDHITLSRAITDVFPKSSAQKLYYVAVPKSFCPIVRSLNQKGCTIATVKMNIKSVKKLKKLAWYEHATQKFFSGPLPTPNLTFIRNYEYFRLITTNN